MHFSNNILNRLCWLLLGLATGLPVDLAMAQESAWRPTRPDALTQRAKDQVAARRPGQQETTPPTTQAGTTSILPFAEAEATGQGSAVVAAQHSEIFDIEMESGFPPSESGEFFDGAIVAGDISTGCDCPECSYGLVGSANPLYDMLGQLNGCGWWVSADYLAWSFDGMDLPALVTTSPNGTAPAATGILGLGSTSTLFGGTVGDDFRSGGKLTVGMWIDPHREWSWEVSYLGFDSDRQSGSFHSSNTPNLARPVFDTLTGSESALLVAHTDFLTGGITVDTATELQAFEVLRRQPWWSDDVYHIDLLLGYKHGDLDEFLRIDDSSTYRTAQGPILANTTITRFDQFEVENSFDGFVIGLDRRHRWRGWLLGYTGKVSLGANQARVRIDGRTTTTVPNGGTAIASGGLLAQTTNIGDYRRDEFAVIPEFEFVARRQVTDRVRLHAGYSLLYWSGASRVGDTLSRRVSQFPPEPVSGTADPKFSWTDNGFFAHGFQFGLDYKF